MSELTKAIIKLQGLLEPVHKDAKGNWGKYATLIAVQQEVLPKLKQCGLAIMQPLSHIDGAPAIKTIVMHESGESITDVTPLILPKNDPQGQGSAITYARRYSLAATIGLVIDDDDDGQRATDVVQKQGSYKASDNRPATDKQKAYLNTLYKTYCTSSGDQRSLTEWMADEHGITEPTKATSADVSLLIEELK